MLKTLDLVKPNLNISGKDIEFNKLMAKIALIIDSRVTGYVFILILDTETSELTAINANVPMVI